MDWYLSTMFHGDEKTEYVETEGFQTRLTCLTVNDYIPRSLIQPCYDFYIRSDLEADLVGLPNVALEPVQNLKVVRHQYALGGPSFFSGEYYWRDPMVHTPEHFLRSLPVVAPPAAVRYSKLTVGNIDDVRTGSSVSAKSRIRTILGDDKTIDLPLDWELLNSFPALQSEHGLILREDVLTVLKPHLPVPFFRVQSLNVV